MDEFTDVIQEYFETQIKNDQQEKPERLGAHKKKSKDVGMTEEGAPRSRGPDSHRSGHTRWDWGRKISPTLRSKLAYILLGSHSELLPALLASLVIHIVLIIWSIFHDMTFRFKYTDIDYHVFSDAARFVRNGCSPYERYTYRYSPIIAYLLYPNGITKELWGKFLFSGCNLVTGALLYDILKTIRGLNTRKALGFTYIWLLNPYIIVLATRGSSDSLTAAIICYLIRSMLKDGPTKKNAATFALAVSIRMYTIIYSIVFWLAISPRISEAVDKTEDISGIFNRARRYMRKIQPIFALRRTKWALTSALTFFAINGIFYYK